MMKLENQGMETHSVLAKLKEMRREDARWDEGQTFSLIYNAGEKINRLLEDSYSMFLQSNALSISAFPSLKQLEKEVIEITADLLSLDKASGSMTSGGTESICMAVKTARDYAKSNYPNIKEPEMILPVSAHPAFNKAAHYFNVKVVSAPLANDHRVDMDAVRDLVNENTILLVGSSPGFPHGVVDPISELSDLAIEKKLLLHVDACLGGFMLPFIKELGYEVPAFDFSLPGVTSMSCDLHKYGYAAKGASVILYRDFKLRRHQFFAHVDWPGGIYGSPTVAGARGGGPIAAAWAVLKYLGKEGFLKLAKDTMETTEEIIAAVNNVDGLEILGKPAMCVFSFKSDQFNIYSLGDELQKRGWYLDRQQLPASLHMMITPVHKEIKSQLIKDLNESVELVRNMPPATSGVAAVYGMLAAIDDSSTKEQFVYEFMEA